MRRGPFVLMSILLDAALVNLGIVVAFLIRFAGVLPAYNFDAYVRIAPAITVAYVVSAWVGGLYEPEDLDDVWTIAQRVMVASAIGTVLTAAIAFFGGTATVSFARLTLLIAWPVVATVLVVWRYLFLRFGSIRWPKQRVLVLGTGSVALELVSELERRRHWGWSCVGIVAAGQDDDGLTAHGSLAVGNVRDLERIVSDTGANRLIVVDPTHSRELIERLVLAHNLRIRIDVVPELYEVFIGQFDSQIGDIPLINVSGRRTPEYFPLVKRVLDIAFASALLVVAAPVLVAVALLILLEDGGPVVFRQKRVGKDGMPFEVLKLRTMVKDAEMLTGPVLAADEDPRITRIGRFLRSYRIDELPQAVNIVRGDMSFVGPRPERPYFVERYREMIPGYAERFRVRPGVTGLAQVSGGYATTPEHKLRYDLIYIYHSGAAMDMRIVLETLKVVLTGKGAR